MRCLVVALLGATAMGIVSASAADLPVTAPPVPFIPPLSWTGFYGGLNAGWVGSTGNSISNSGTDTGGGGLGTAIAVGAIPTSVDLATNGFIGGAQLGYNWQANNWVFGLEGDFNGTSANNDTTVGPITVTGYVPQTTTYNRQLSWLATVRGRIGMTATPAVLIYATGGLAVGQTKLGTAYICPACSPSSASQAGTSNSSSQTQAGWTVGGGVEWMFAPRWSAKAEYLFVDLGNQDTTIAYSYGGNTSTMTSSIRNQFSVVRAGVNYHF